MSREKMRLAQAYNKKQIEVGLIILLTYQFGLNRRINEYQIKKNKWCCLLIVLGIHNKG
jgi:hypothetical protein